MRHALDYLGPGELHVRALTLALSIALAGLVAIWAAKSRVHWLLRGLAIWGCVMALTPITAYGPAAVLTLSLPATVALVRLADWRLKRRGGTENDAASRADRLSFRFGLSDLFFLMFFIGLTLAGLMHVARHLPRLNMGDWLAPSWAVCSVAFGAYACAASRRRWPRVNLLILLIGFAAFVLSRINSGVFSHTCYLLYHPLVSDGTIFNNRISGVAATAALILTEAAVLTLLVLGLATMAVGPNRSPRKKLAGRFGLSVFAIVTVTPLLWLYWQMLWPAPAPPRRDSAGNRFDEVFAVARRIESLKAATPSGLNPQQADLLLTEAARLLESPSRPPDPDGTSMPLRLQGALWDHLYLGFDGEAFAAANAGDNDRAIRFALADMNFGAMHRRGGNLYSNQQGMIPQWAAIRHLARIRSRLTPEQARTIMKALANAAEDWDPAGATLAIDDAAYERRYGWAARLDRALNRLLGTEEYPWFESRWRRHLALNLLLRTDLAIRLFEHDHNKLPEALGDLVPGYLREIPIDPYDNQPLRYQPAEGSFALYSVGRDGRDDGGRFTQVSVYNAETGYDLAIDMLNGQ